jgi:hypothetical protein
MANYMAEVAKLFGVERGEEFEIQYPSPCSVKTTAVFSEDGFKVTHTDGVILQPYWEYAELHCLLNGTLTIKRKPWKPQNDEAFFVISFDGNIMIKYWDDESTLFKTYYKIGNCYHYKSDAEADRDKWMRFYASDEVLEV